MPRYADVDKLMKHAVNMDWSALRWVNEVDICTAINPCVVERKKGKWISRKNEPKHKYWWTCSECQGRFDYEWKFCPNCGADMREENDNG